MIALGNRGEVEKPASSPNMVYAAIKDLETGEVTLGSDHFDCRVRAFRIQSGEWQDAEVIIASKAFQTFIHERKYDNGFCGSLLEYFTRAEATYIASIGNYVGRDGQSLLHSSEILA